MSSPILSRRDLDFLLYEWLDVAALTARPRFSEHSKDTFDAVIDLGADIATKRFRPHNKKSDTNEPMMRPDGTVELIPEIKDALDAFGEAGLVAATFDEALGGLQLPTAVARASLLWFQAANAGTSAYPVLTIANANLLAEHASASQIDTYLRPMLEGRFFGTMCLSEPHAGSSLTDVTTKARPAGDGTYRVTGTKMWITGGDHELTENIVHLVLAKVPGGGPGVHGLSLFIVPKYLPDGTRNDVTLVSLNHKMGNRGATNALLNFGDGTYPVSDEAGAIGYLVGDEHRGLTYMFHMMNEVRIDVGLVATAVGYTGFLQALEYAKVRTQGRKTGEKNPSSHPVPLIEHTDVKRMLLAQKSYVEGALALGLYCSLLVDEQQTADTHEQRTRATLLLDVLTPISKSWPAQWCLEANSLAIQVHGGYGYTRDYDVEQLYRDNRLNAIHEGTHGIQGLDLLGRKVVMQEGAGLQLLVDTIGQTIARVDESRAAADTAGYAKELGAAVERLTAVTSTLWSANDVAVTLANSSIYLEAAGHVVLAWIWLEQLLATDGKDGDFYNGKRAAAQYFYHYELPKTAPQFDLLSSLDRTTVDVRPDWF
ncbi:acyl-CoA dehydrogenase [Rhodococcus opacus]|uniref:acyl-CoA dehydrogenase n=1 Tax=Rhodococcus opacus TaxID=37919 RepID=UPI001C48B6D0|nr:acyl-CoA dehydrogenase [Rhodococcus opacus]MBV6759068.1 acyl-CoA dehydrogenase [Rhodococcus opacus]